LKIIKQYSSRLGLVLALAISGATSAAQYDLALTALGGSHDGDTLWVFDPLNAPIFVSNLSTIDIDGAVLWGAGGTTGIFNATDIEVNYFGAIYNLNDAIGAVTVEWVEGQMVDVNYVTADFSLDVPDTYSTKEWQGVVQVSHVPVPGAFLMFSSALGLLALSVRKK
jgi:hypothetical protein